MFFASMHHVITITLSRSRYHMIISLVYAKKVILRLSFILAVM